MCKHAMRDSLLADWRGHGVASRFWFDLSHESVGRRWISNGCSGRWCDRPLARNQASPLLDSGNRFCVRHSLYCPILYGWPWPYGWRSWAPCPSLSQFASRNRTGGYRWITGCCISLCKSKASASKMLLLWSCKVSAANHSDERLRSSLAIIGHS